MAIGRAQKGLDGIKVVMHNLNKELDKIGGKSMNGLIKAAILIRRDMDKIPPKIPVDLGNLRASSFIVAGNGITLSNASFSGPDSAKFAAEHASEVSKQRGIVGRRKLVAIGFSASYAALVEGDITTKRTRPGSGGAFFKSSLARNRKAIIKVIKKTAKIK